MIDYIKVIFIKQGLYDHYKEHICKYPKMNVHTEEIEYFTNNFHGLHVIIKGDSKIQISGSLHKFYHGNNCGIFTRENIEAAVKKFQELFLIPPGHPELYITQLEFGINIPTEHAPMLYAKSMLSYSKKNFSMTNASGRSNKEYGCSCKITDNLIKFYDKYFETEFRYKKGEVIDKEIFLAELPKNYLRYEVAYHRLKSTPFECGLDDLYSVRWLNLMARDLIKKYARIKKIRPLDTYRMSNRQLEIYYAGLNQNYWWNLKERGIEPYKTAQKRFNALTTEFKFPTGDLVDELEDKIPVILDRLIGSSKNTPVLQTCNIIGIPIFVNNNIIII